MSPGHSCFLIRVTLDQSRERLLNNRSVLMLTSLVIKSPNCFLLKQTVCAPVKSISAHSKCGLCGRSLCTHTCFVCRCNFFSFLSSFEDAGASQVFSSNSPPADLRCLLAAEKEVGVVPATTSWPEVGQRTTSPAVHQKWRCTFRQQRPVLLLTSRAPLPRPGGIFSAAA